MILCLLGTNPYPFYRLAKSVDQLAQSLNKKVTIQLGYTDYSPEFCDSFDFIGKKELDKLIEESVLVISQGGYGSLTDALLKEKNVIAVPRRKDLNECQDDQTEIVAYFHSRNYLSACYSMEELPDLASQMLEGRLELSKFEPESSEKVSSIIFRFLGKHI